MNDQPQFTLDDLGERWGRLLSQSFAQIITLEKQLSAALAANADLGQRIDRMRMELHQTQVDLASAQSKTIIGEAKQKAMKDG